MLKAIAGAWGVAALVAAAIGCSTTSATPDHGGADTGTDAPSALDGDVDGGFEAGPKVPMCLGSADCMTGQICCSDSTTTTMSCQVGPCPSMGSVQICTTAADCFVAGDTCDPANPCSPGLPIRICNGPGYTGACGPPDIDAAPGDATSDAASGPDGTASDGGAAGDAGPIYCGHPSDCAAGTFCAASGTCQAGECSGASPCIYGYACGSSGVCASSQPGACDRDVQCSSGALCLAGANGNGGVCIPPASQCFDGIQCDPGDKCVAGKCAQPCTSTANCRDGYGCNTTTGVCVTPLKMCLVTNDCGSALQVCVDGACVPRSSGATCATAGDVWTENGCVPNQSATFACTTEGQLGSGAGAPGVSCAQSQICVHGDCWISCDAPNQSACAGQPTLTVCKPVTTGATTYNVCGTAQGLGNQCGPGASNQSCTGGATCIDGDCM